MIPAVEAKIRVAAARTVALPPAEAYARLLRADRYGLWWPGRIRFEAPPGPVREGSRLVLRTLGDRSEAEVVGLEEGRAIYLRFISGSLAGTGEWLLKPDGEGTRVAFRLRAEPVTLWLRLLCALFDLGRPLTRWTRAALERLDAPGK